VADLAVADFAALGSGCSWSVMPYVHATLLGQQYCTSTTTTMAPCKRRSRSSASSPSSSALQSPSTFTTRDPREYPCHPCSLVAMLCSTGAIIFRIMNNWSSWPSGLLKPVSYKLGILTCPM
jgi:hypothetical protein